MFYVTYETAKLLKEKGFNKIVDKLIHLNQYNIPIIESPEKYYDESEVYNDYLYLKKNHYVCPTKSEVIDWLESKGIVVELRYENDELQKDDSEWEYYIYQYDNEGRLDETVSSWGMGMFYDTRLEAEEDAIIKALELL